MKTVLVAIIISVWISGIAFAADNMSGVYVNKTATLDVLKLSDSRAKIFLFTRGTSKYSNCNLGTYGKIAGDTVYASLPNPDPSKTDCEITVKLTEKTASVTATEFCGMIMDCDPMMHYSTKIRTGAYTKTKAKTVLKPDAEPVDEEDEPPVQTFYGARDK